MGGELPYLLLSRGNIGVLQECQTRRQIRRRRSGLLKKNSKCYLWNVNRLCSAFDYIQPYFEECGDYQDADSFISAELELATPVVALIVVQWTAIVSLMLALIMWSLASVLLDSTMGERQHRASGL